ncbi:MAG: tryptophan synthase subunit alpha [Pseudomonadota bacterium]|nr:tryptophan synthase subunit alpha [Gammaproteobacteria bacterium]MEE2684226.1 tryptophan synthase subunit alpha [Pseudomonadota bacterium]|tara:strand:- start:6138 stop:6899 length:762 start_codon:yes stop_codon:yes gene_type:complete
MLPHEILENALADSNGSALIPFITAGYPTCESFLTNLKEISKVADAIEIGVPFTDPLADGVTVQKASLKALNNGVSLSWIFDQLSKIDFEISSPLLLMSYLNPLYAFGFDRLAQYAKKNNVSGFIVPDLPYEECLPLKASLDKEGIALVQLVSPETPVSRLENICKHSKGFVYAVTRTGITGKETSLPKNLTKYLDLVKNISSIPVCAGFGVRNSEQVKLISKHADGVIVGSALLEAIEKNKDLIKFLQALKK